MRAGADHVWATVQSRVGEVQCLHSQSECSCSLLVSQELRNQVAGERLHDVFAPVCLQDSCSKTPNEPSVNYLPNLNKRIAANKVDRNDIFS